MAIGLSSTLAALGDFPLITTDDIQGGYRVAADAATRNSIGDSHRVEGMLVRLADTGILYTLNAGPWTGTDSDWSEAGMQGPQGETGPPGPPGATGSTGPAGPPGATLAPPHRASTQIRWKLDESAVPYANSGNGP